MNAKPTLICIPDISGFTKFMSEVDIELSSLVIPLLLNKIIYSNNLGLQVSEIEGDAVLFYRTGPLPAFEDLIDQCKLFYTDFYSQLKKLKKDFKDHKHNHLIPDILGLKIILHYGEEIGAVQIGQNIKLMGEDVIIAHRLLKNDIASYEYLLLSENLINEYKESIIDQNFEWGTLKEGDDQYRHLGAINYRYIDLKPLI